MSKTTTEAVVLWIRYKRRLFRVRLSGGPTFYCTISHWAEKRAALGGPKMGRWLRSTNTLFLADIEKMVAKAWDERPLDADGKDVPEPWNKEGKAAKSWLRGPRSF